MTTDTANTILELWRRLGADGNVPARDFAAMVTLVDDDATRTELIAHILRSIPETYAGLHQLIAATSRELTQPAEEEEEPTLGEHPPIDPLELFEVDYLNRWEARPPRTVTEVLSHPAFTDGATDEATGRLFDAMVGDLGHTEASRLWQAACNAYDAQAEEEDPHAHQ